MVPRYADVVFDLPFTQRFTYEIPAELMPVVRKGIRVFVPFGHRKTTGYVVDVVDSPPANVSVKKIQDVLDVHPVFSDQILQLCEWISQYYLCGLGEVLRSALPPGLLMEEKRVVSLKNEVDPERVAELKARAPLQYKILQILLQKRKMRLDALGKRLGRRAIRYACQRLMEEGYVTIDEYVSGKASHAKRRKLLRLLEPGDRALETLPARASRQRAIISHLAALGGSGGFAEVVRHTKADSRSVQMLVRRGLVAVFERRIERDYYGDLDVPPAPQLILNEGQKNAVAEICSALQQETNRVYLIHGVTGSGKTQVYIESIRETLKLGRDAIVLVPEISLTPQAVRRFRSEFQELVAVLHSRMSHGERYDAWRKIKEGRARVVIGARSAVFAPVQRLGLIVVDEEHDTSYKQSDNAPRYHGRDVAVVRAALEKATVVLGTATPSVESYHNALRGKYTLLELPNRIDDIPLPAVRLVNLAREKKPQKTNGTLVISRALSEKIEDRIARGEQVIILQNRRGYATAVRCRDCGEVQMCPNCNISLTYHRNGRQMRCHYCNIVKRAPALCPECGSIEIQYRGIGTQKVEESFARTFPGARVVRMDLDTTRGRKAHDKILQQFARHEYDILIGTQMIAKGHDFPRVTLVGVISADTGLYLPDFRASERTFQLLTQVAGRAGRKNEQGEVIIQTYSVEHFCLQCAREHDFKKFFFAEMQDRRLLRYPPFSRLVLLQFRHLNESKTLAAASYLRQQLSQQQELYDVLGPAPAPLTRLQKYFRYQIILKSDAKQDPAAKRMRQSVADAVIAYRKESKYRDVKLSIDIDPVMIL